MSDAFALALAEVLLQKTRAAAAVETWCELVRLFPTPSSLLEASDVEVQRLVQPLGLGVQRTGRLKAMARNWDALSETGKSLPGLGPYGSAVVRFAMGVEDAAAPVDGNIARVLTRFYGFTFEKGEPRKKPAVRNAVRNALQEACGTEAKLLVIYALVDLGAVVCKPGKPSCEECPLRVTCVFSKSLAEVSKRTSATATPRDCASGGGTASETS